MLPEAAKTGQVGCAPHGGEALRLDPGLRFRLKDALEVRADPVTGRLNGREAYQDLARCGAYGAANFRLATYRKVRWFWADYAPSGNCTVGWPRNLWAA